MSEQASLHLLRFEPIFQYRMWGGRKLEGLVAEPLPADQPIGEAWILSDRADFPSAVAEGPLKGKTVHELIALDRQGMFGTQSDKFEKYPLLLKFLDAREMLSVQVHPSDQHRDLLPPGERGKTEAWLVLDSDPGSSIYAGLRPGATEAEMREALHDGTVESLLASFSPKPGDGLFIEAGTVHALGGGVLVFEVQQNSDVTFRLFDWNRVDAKTGKTRELHIDESIQSTDFAKGPVMPSIPVPVEDANAKRERLFSCEFFEVQRVTSASAFEAGADNYLRAIVILSGHGTLRTKGSEVAPFTKGQVWLIPAVIGKVTVEPSEECALVEIALP